MPASALFEDFSNVGKSQEVTGFDPEPIVEDNPSGQQSFDDGYKEGWVDAQAASKSDQDRINADVATALQEAGFAYFEARQHIFNSMRPLLEAMVTQVLPKIAQTTFIPLVIEQIHELAQQTEPPLRLLCSSELEEELKAIAASQLSFPVEILTEDSLSKTQVLLQMSNGETRIDLDQTLTGLEAAIVDFYELTNEKDVVNG
jgi:flagellar assembly protein FliH